MEVNRGVANYPSIPEISKSSREAAEKHDLLASIADAFSGKAKNLHGSDFKLRINMKFKTAELNDTTSAVDANSTAATSGDR